MHKINTFKGFISNLFLRLEMLNSVFMSESVVCLCVCLCLCLYVVDYKAFESKEFILLSKT